MLLEVPFRHGLERAIMKQQQKVGVSPAEKMRSGEYVAAVSTVSKEDLANIMKMYQSDYQESSADDESADEVSITPAVDDRSRCVWQGIRTFRKDGYIISEI